ncbi:MAG: YceI family protein, partial [Acidimicrobiales bacterium]|nr:YceI family protein [Acidimicrobiales bacterium]
GGSWVYIKVLSDDPPAKLTIDDASSSNTTVPGGSDDGTADGEWSATSDSIVGYRVKETLFGASTEAVGRTSEVEGSITIAGTGVTKGSFTVDMASISSDRSQRDGQFRSRIMETSEFPMSTFELTSPIALATTDADQEVQTKATGKLTLHGVTKTVSFDVIAKRTNGQIKVNGAIPVVFDDYDIDDPSGGPAQVGDDGTLEFTLVFEK